METVILILHILACVTLVILVLLQSGKEGMGVIFGGGNASVFGSAGAGGVLVRLTTFVAIIFLCTSLGYNVVSSSNRANNDSRLSGLGTETPITAPAPAAPQAPAAPEAPATPVTPAPGN